jgi:hypothetical protein
LLPYGIVFCVMSLSAFLNRKSTKQFSLVVFILCLLFYSLRNNVGSDWDAYEYYFDKIHSEYLIDNFSFEIGYWALNYVSSGILGSYRYLVLLVGIFNGILFWKATNRYTKNIGIAMLLSSFYLFFPTLEALRQSITLFLFYYSLAYIDKSPKRYIILNFLGILFHTTGIITLLFFVFYRYRLFRLIIATTLVLWGVFETYISKIINYIPFVSNKYHWYFHVDTVEPSLFTLKTLEYLLIVLFFYVISRKKDLGNQQKLYSNLIFLGLIIQITLGQMSSIVYRMTYFTDIGVILVYCLLYDKMKAPLWKYTYIVGLILYVLLRFYRVFPFGNSNFIYSI